MAFPVGYKEVRLPALVLHALHLLAFFRKLIAALCPYIGLPNFLAHEISRPGPIQLPHRAAAVVAEADDTCSAAARIIDEIVPAIRYTDLRPVPEDCCSVCLAEFETDDDEIRRLADCRHVFHRICLDRWMVIYRKLTCPVCRNRFAPNELTEYLKQTVWGNAKVGGYNGLNFF